MIKDEIRFASILNIEPDVVEKVRQWRNRPNIRKFMINDHIISEEEHIRWYENLKGRQDVKVWVAYQNDIPFGVMNLNHIDYDNKSTDWGMYIGEEAFRGKGFSKLMLFNLMNYAFNKIEMKRMYTTLLANNDIAIDLYKKMGFEEEGRPCNKILRDGNYIDMLTMSISLEKWNGIREGIISYNCLNEVMIE